MKKIFINIILSLLLIVVLFSGFIYFSYIKVLPIIISDDKVINKAEYLIKKYINLDVDITNPKIITSDYPKVRFSMDNLTVKKDNNILADIKKIDILISLMKLFNKTVIVENLGADDIFIDVDKIIELFPKNDKKDETFKSDWNIDLFDSVLYINKINLLYHPVNDTLLNINASDINIDNRQKIKRFVHANFIADIQKNTKNINVKFKDDNKIYIQNKQLIIDNCPLFINKSKIFFKLVIDKKDYDLSVFAEKFSINDVVDLLNTNIVENNINESLSMLSNLNGNFDFDIKMNQSGISGFININKISAKLKALNNLPFIINSGEVAISGDNIILKDFKGYYDNKKNNTVTMEGFVSDYLNTMKTNVIIRPLLTNDLVSKYISKVSGVDLKLTAPSQSKIIVDFLGNKFDIKMMGKISKGDDILVEGASLSPVNYDRALTMDMHLSGNILNIEKIKYFISKELNKQTKDAKPIIALSGNVNITNGKILDLGFEILRPLPSEFLNVLISQRMFRRGKFWGNMHYYNTGMYPVLKGDLEAEKVIIPSMSVFLKKGVIKADSNYINTFAQGKFRRCNWEFNGSILNKVLFPIVIKNTSFVVDNIDIDRLMHALNNPVKKSDFDNEDIENNSDNSIPFDVTNLIVENAEVKILKGNYNDINFNNVTAEMSLNKDGIFNLQSNLFEIAEGYTNAKVNCDLKRHKYNMRLGIKEVNSDIMIGSILNLRREIEGKASGLIELNTDESLKLNGRIKFLVTKGKIQKIGLVQYILNFASVFRNPVTMISPSILSDIINIPEGNFDKITGDLFLKNNIIEMMQIKSYSPSLSAYIVGRYDLENSDAILRIYTKFTNKHKGFGGFLRNLSLNSLANRIPLKSRNDANYYSSELEQLPDIDADEKDCQIFVTKVDGDVEHNNFLSSLKKIK